jgi:hypothetical protein
LCSIAFLCTCYYFCICVFILQVHVFS